MYLLLLPVFLKTSCSKNQTKFFSDTDDPGLAIFSNHNNNVMTCYVKGQAWRSVDRISYSTGNTSFEVTVAKKINNTSLFDTLIINWIGNYQSPNSRDKNITLTLPVAKGFNYKSFSNFEGQRMVIDTTNGYFSSYIDDFYQQKEKGSGSIFFLTAHLDSLSPNNYIGKMSGLFEAKFNTSTITRGRFDHSLTYGNVYFN